MGNEGSKGGSGKTVVKNPFKSGPSSSLVLQHVDNAKKSRILQLKNSSLKVVPEQIQEVHAFIRNLDLGVNKITILPPFIGTFRELKQLHLNSNLLQTLPSEIGQLSNLEVLDVSQNRLTSLPETFITCSSLKKVNLSQNNLALFPLELCRLSELDVLNLSQNRITSLPDDVSTLCAEELNLNGNQVALLNSPALVQCPRLVILRVEDNCLSKDQFDLPLLQDSKIALIAHSGNIFQDSDFQDLPGYESYQTRYTATRRKM